MTVPDGPDPVVLARQRLADAVETALERTADVIDAEQRRLAAVSSPPRPFQLDSARRNELAISAIYREAAEQYVAKRVEHLLITVVKALRGTVPGPFGGR